MSIDVSHRDFVMQKLSITEDQLKDPCANHVERLPELLEMKEAVDLNTYTLGDYVRLLAGRRKAYTFAARYGMVSNGSKIFFKELSDEI